MAEQATVKASSAVLGSRGTINIRLGEKVTLQTLHGIIDRITNMTGCPTCGLLGIDLIIGGDPVELHQIEQIPGVRSVGFGG